MRGIEIRPFSDDHVDDAARLLADRHRRHRAAEPLVADVIDFRAQVERDWRHEGASGAVALRAGDVVAYVVGRPARYGTTERGWMLVDLAGHAVDGDPELLRDVYGAAADRWVDDGYTRHGVFVPASDAALVRTWSRLVFGVQAATAVRETAVEPPFDADVEIRRGTPDDLEAAARLDRVLHESMVGGPSFSGLEPASHGEVVEEWRDTWDDEQFEHFVAERDGRVVGQALLYRRPSGDLRVPEVSIDLANAATDPEIRGGGVGRALTAHVLTWAHEHGYPVMTTDWRMVNLLASRFWPRRGWRETFLRMYRSVP